MSVDEVIAVFCGTQLGDRFVDGCEVVATIGFLRALCLRTTACALRRSRCKCDCPLEIAGLVGDDQWGCLWCLKGLSTGGYSSHDPCGPVRVMR